MRKLLTGLLLIGALLTPARASSDEFALALYSKLSTQQKGNFFFSPFSLASALAMTAAGARGETAAQMNAVLHLKPSDNWKVSAPAGAAYKLNVANRIWVGTPVLPAYLKVLKDRFGADAREIDLANHKAAIQAINAWVAKQTADKIPKLLTSLPQNSQLVLTNAIYFKSKWKQEFNPQATREEEFHIGEGKTVKAPMMTTTGMFEYAKIPEAQVLAMPYQREELSLILMLPDKRDGLPALERSLTAANWKKWTSSPVDDTEVNVKLPRFKSSSTLDPKAALIALGMPLAFTDGADFSGMTGSDDLKIGAVIHQAAVEVNEEGTEAAAATAVVMVTKSAAVKRPVQVHCDHPFLYGIRDNKTGNLLFLGRLEDPTK